MTYGTTIAVRDYLAAGYQAVITSLAAKAGLRFDLITDYSVGWSDPFTLPRYPAALIIPDATTRNVDERTIMLPLWIFAAYRSADARLLTYWQLIAIDAAYEYINGSNIAVRTFLDEAVPYTPTAGIAVVELRATAMIDILGGYNG